ncbi:hypothetical protein Bbelb_002450 [Branchiostoma belcheri]|nr:hypothetical protein Bbelb_002450 [Branchiostoma belcheri]
MELGSNAPCQKVAKACKTFRRWGIFGPEPTWASSTCAHAKYSNKVGKQRTHLAIYRYSMLRTTRYGPNMGRGLNVADFIQQTKGFSSENKRSADLISKVSDNVLADGRKFSEFENENRNSSEWAGLSTLKGVNQGLRDKCQSCAEEIRRNAEKQKEDYRYIWETIIATKQSVPDFLRKLGLGQYTTAFTGVGFEDLEVEDLLDVDIKKGEDIPGDRCWVDFDGERLEMTQGHLRTLRQEIQNLRERKANIPHRMKSIISSADEAARTSNRFLEACRESVSRAKSLKAETRRAAQEARRRQGNGAAVGLGALGLAAIAATGGLAAPLVVGAAAVGTWIGMLTRADDLMSSSAISSDTFEEDVIDDLDDHQRKMGEKAQELNGQWLNEIHTCVTMMESNSAAVKHKLVAFPSSVGSVRSNFDTIFENLETLRSNANKYETGSAYWSERVRAVTAERVCPRCGRSHSHGLSGAHAQCKIQ